MGTCSRASATYVRTRVLGDVLGNEQPVAMLLGAWQAFTLNTTCPDGGCGMWRAGVYNAKGGLGLLADYYLSAVLACLRSALPGTNLRSSSDNVAFCYAGSPDDGFVNVVDASAQWPNPQRRQLVINRGATI